MLWLYLLYVVGMVATLCYACWAGGSAERWAAAIVVAASVASWMLREPSRAFRQPELPTGIVDALAAVGFAAVMLRSRKFWPVWATACAIAGALVTPARYLVRDVHFRTYFATEAIWPVGIMLAIALGTAARSRPNMVLGHFALFSKGSPTPTHRG